MKRGHAIALAASGAAALGFPAVVRAQTSTLRIAASTAATQAEGYFADQLGFFKQAGITATISTTGRGSETIEAVVRGDIDMASATPEGIANAVIHNIPLRIIATGAIYVEPLLVTYTKLPLETLHAIVKPVWAERAERSNVEPQLASAARYKVISRPVSYDEVVQG